MSAEERELLEKVAIAMEAAKKWSLYKILTGICCTGLIIFGLGQKVGDWSNWRSNTDKRLDKLEVVSGGGAQKSNYITKR